MESKKIVGSPANFITTTINVEGKERGASTNWFPKLENPITVDSSEISGFRMNFEIPTGLGDRVVVLTRDTTTTGGGGKYAELRVERGVDIDTWQTAGLVTVGKTNNDYYTKYRAPVPNFVNVVSRVGLNILEVKQFGIKTYDGGETYAFREYLKGRWRRHQNGIMVPVERRFGTFEAIKGVLNVSAVEKMFEGVTLSKWEGGDSEVNPEVDPIPSGNHVRVLWFTPWDGYGDGYAMVRCGDDVTAILHTKDIGRKGGQLIDLGFNQPLSYKERIETKKGFMIIGARLVDEEASLKVVAAEATSKEDVESDEIELKAELDNDDFDGDDLGGWAYQAYGKILDNANS